MHSPDDSPKNLQGASRTSGGILRGRTLVMPKFSPEPKFKPDFWEPDRKFSPKFSTFAEPDVKFGPAFTWMSVFLNAFERGSNRTYGDNFVRWIFFFS